MDRRAFLRAAPMLGLAATAPVIAAEPARPVFEPLVYAEDRVNMWEVDYPKPSRRERAIWHMRELERLAKHDGASEAMVTVVGRFYAPAFHCKTLMLDRGGVLDDFGRPDFLA